MASSDDSNRDVRLSRRRLLGGVGSLSATDLRGLGQSWFERTLEEALRADATPKPIARSAAKE